MLKYVVFVGLFLAAAGCGGDSEAEQFERRLSDAVSKSDETGKPFRLPDVTDFEWDRVWFFEGYTSRDDIEAATDSPDSDLPEEAPEADLIVFTDDDVIVESFTMPSLPNAIDPLCLPELSPLRRERASLVVRAGEPGLPEEKFLVARDFWESPSSLRSPCRQDAPEPRAG